MDEFSISLWFKSNSAPTSNEEFLTWWSNDSSDVYNDGFLGFGSGNTIRFGDGWVNAYSFPNTNYVGSWTHVVAVKSSNNAYLYINGSLVATKGSALSWGFNRNLIIGGDQGGGEYFDGSLDQIRLFNKELSSSEVTTLYGESNTSTTKSTTDIFDDGSGVALYEFEEGAKDTGGVTGYIGNGGIFNGSNSKITLPNSFFDNNASHSISFWVFFNDASPASEQQIFFAGEENFRLQTNGTLRFRRWIGGSGNDIDSSAVSENQWYQITCTYNTASGMVLYINGTSVGTNSSTTNVLTNAAKSLGYRGDNNTGYFNGKIDQVRIFDKALSSSEVTTLYQETSASSTKSTTDIFDDSSGVALYELEGNANDTGGITGRLSGTEAAVFTNADNSNFNLGNARVVNNSFGVSFWVKMNKISQSENVYLCSFMYGSNTSLYMDTNNVLQVSNGGYSRNESFSTTHTFAADTWYHIVYTGQIVGDSTLRCYVNGTQVGSRGWISGHNYTVTSGNRIGSYSNGDNSIDGNIADFRIYKSTHLSSSDVTALYSGTPPTTGLTEFYSFNGNDEDAQGNRVLTASNVTYNNNGTATNVTYAYDGTPTNVSFVGTSFQPDLVWVKNRDSIASNFIHDSVRGIDNDHYRTLITNEAYAESTFNQSWHDSYGRLSSISSNGFTINQGSVTNDTSYNNSGDNYVAWCWKAGGTAVSNTDGSITSSVSANQDAGFSIVKWTGNQAVATVGHGLNSAPELIISKSATYPQNWAVYSEDVGNQYWLRLNDSNAKQDEPIWNDTTPTNSVFSINANVVINKANETSIAYCFHSVDGYQKIGSYTGNGSTTGPIITTGFKPRFILTKPSSIADNWSLWDNVRDPGNTIDQILVPNSLGVESANGFGRYDIDLLSNGFQLKRTDSQINQNGATYIYLAIA